MNFKLVSKNNLGVVATLLLVVLLSQAQFFNFLLDSVLGRCVLILFILFIAYTNKILGVVAVLFIIIMFNQSYMGFLEGFTDASGQTVDMSGNKIDVSGNTVTGQQGNTLSLSSGSSTVTDASGQTANVGSGQIAKQVKQVVSQKKTNLTGAEGFDLIGTENNMKRGKQSNTIPVNYNMRESSQVDAFDGSFTNSYSKF